MKLHQCLLILGCLGTWIPGICPATNVGTSTVVQPINLGANSDPSRIPLGEVGVVSNYGYGTLRVISEPRPCPDQPMRWKDGVELNQNLASVFGISVVAGDLGATPKPPVILRVGSWKPPGYSPYTKDQAVAATLWCLLQEAGGTPESPLVVKVVTESPDDRALEAKYSGTYVTRPGENGVAVPPVKVPGTVLETDARGIQWVVFPEVRTPADFRPIQPGMIVLQKNGADESEGAAYLLPVWGSGEEGESPLRLNHFAASINYPCFKNTGRSEANQFLLEGGAMGFEVDQDAKGDSVRLDYPRVSQETLAADLHALVLTALPTAEHPLNVSILLEQSQLADYPAFRGAPGWKETETDPTHHYLALTCRLAWDPAARKLTTGSIPLVELAKGSNQIQRLPTRERAREEAEALADSVFNAINEGIHDGTLTAEKNMADDMLSSHGLQRQIGLAGYYEALASFCDERGLSGSPVKDPVALGNSQLDQCHNLGWVIGRARGLSILKARQEAAAKGPAPGTPGENQER